jgi:AcrR family transcriptional regulator
MEIQRARLIAAMVDVSAERGASNATVAHVVQRAGVSRRTFYEIFPDREACFLAAFDDAVVRSSRYMLDAYDPGARWVQRVRSALTGLLWFLDVERCAGRLLIVGSLVAGTRVLERRRRVLAQIVAVVDEGRTEAKTGIEPPSLTAEGIVGGVFSVLHERLTAGDPGRLVQLTGQLMSMIVLPYLGPVAAREELARPVPSCAPHPRPGGASNALMELGTRLTYRTVRVLMAVAADPGASNRAVGDSAGIGDQGQTSKLLARLEKLGLIYNNRLAQSKGTPNAWTLTKKGLEIEQATSGPGSDPSTTGRSWT